MKKLLTTLSIVILGYSGITIAQQFTISGTIEDAATGENLVSANIYESTSLNGVISNYYGFYSLKLDQGKVEIVYSFVGYQILKKSFSLTKDTVINISLTPSIELEEVVVTDKGPGSTVRSTQMSMVEIPIQEIKKLPVLMGETDVLKTIQLLPGVQSGTEGLSGIYVRGGGPDQNLILLDGVPVYNVNHLFGFFSVFNSDAIHSVSLIKGGFPARYGGRLSSVIDIKMKEGNSKELKGTGSIGLISSKFTLEGPIKNENTSFIISARRTYIDILAQPFIALANNMAGDDFNMRTGYFFYDVNAKINHKINNNNRIFFSIYTGKDKFYMKYKDVYDEQSYGWDDRMKMGIHWGNLTSALRLNTIVNKNLFSNLTLTYSDYTFDTGVENQYKSFGDGYSDSWDFGLSYISKISDLGAKYEIDYIPNSNHYIRAGADFVHHLFNPGVLAFKDIYDDQYADQSIDTTFGNKNIFANDFSIYIEDDIKLGNRLKTNIGLRYVGFLLNNKTYTSLEPRISMRVLVTDNFSFKASYAEMQQNIHLLTGSGIGLPTDLWVPSTREIKPEHSRQVAIGSAINIKNTYELTLEAFYKEMSNTVAYGEGESFFNVNKEWYEKISMGKGNSYGVEVMFQKSVGKTSGWIGYTLAWANRQYPEISNGKTFPYKYDRRHDVSLVITHKFSERIDVGMTWVYGTGYRTTLGDEKYLNPNAVFYNTHSDNDIWDADFIENVENRNNYKMPDYHRLDLGVNFHKQKKRINRTWSFGAYNAYSRQNAFILYYDLKNYWNYESEKPKMIVKQVSLFPIIPYFRYSFNF